jgi:hypothetical protein
MPSGYCMAFAMGTGCMATPCNKPHVMPCGYFARGRCKHGNERDCAYAHVLRPPAAVATPPRHGLAHGGGGGGGGALVSAGRPSALAAVGGSFASPLASLPPNARILPHSQAAVARRGPHGLHEVTHTCHVEVPSGERKHNSLIMLADASGSMSGSKISTLRASIAQTVAACEEGDGVSLTLFSSGIQDLLPHVTTKRRLPPTFLPAVAAIGAGGGTAFYDAVLHGVALAKADHDFHAAKRKAQPEHRGRVQRLIFLTDGEDTCSKATVAQAAERLRAPGMPAIKTWIIAVGEEAAAVFAPGGAAHALTTLPNRCVEVVSAASAADIGRAYAEVRTKIMLLTRTESVREVSAGQGGAGGGRGAASSLLGSLASGGSSRRY